MEAQKEMTQELFIPIRLDGLNEYIAAMNSSRYVGNKMKKYNTDIVHNTARFSRLGHFTEPITLNITYWEPNARRDPDNILSAKKFILDGLKNAGVITNDGQKWIKGITEQWRVCGPEDHVGVHVVMTEVDNGRKIN